jgi:hypothetical protein
VAQDPAAAVAFFDMVCGLEPNWQSPDVPWMRRTFAEGFSRIATAKTAELDRPESLRKD